MDKEKDYIEYLKEEFIKRKYLKMKLIENKVCPRCFEELGEENSNRGIISYCNKCGFINEWETE